MAATAARRSARSTAPGVSNGTPASAMRALARVMRCSIAASPTRKARAICLTDRPRDDAQRQRDLLRRRQVGMAADEQQPQDVVAVVARRRAARPARSRRRRGRRSPSSSGSAVCLARARARRRARRCGRRRSARRRGRAAGRSAASSSARAGRPPGRPPRPCRGRGNSAAAPPTAWGRAAVSAASIQADVGHAAGFRRRRLRNAAGHRPDLVAPLPGLASASSLAISSASSRSAQSTM